jgi:serine/threonine protein kinase
MNITNPVDIAFNLSKVYHLQRVTSHTVEGDGETTMVGKTISHYKVIEKLGGGGMGVLCKAEDTRLDLNVALKFLPEKYAQDAKPWNVPRQRHVLLWRYIIPTSGLSRYW